MTKTIDRTTWMSGHYGIMTHWLYPGILPEKGQPAKTFDEAVNQFQLERFLKDFSATGADWLIFTIGQNSGFYASPNSVIDQLAGKGHCSQRDLALEIATEVHRRDKRFIAYLPCEVAGNQALVEGLKACGALEVKFTLVPEGQHDVWSAAYADPALWEWLLAHEKAPVN